MKKQMDISKVLMALANDINTLAVQQQALIELLIDKKSFSEIEIQKKIGETVEKIKQSLMKQNILTPDGRIITPKPTVEEKKEEETAKVVESEETPVEPPPEELKEILSIPEEEIKEEDK